MAKKNLGNEISKRLKQKQKSSDVVRTNVPIKEATVGDLAKEQPKTNNGKGETIYAVLDECYKTALRERKEVERSKKRGTYVGNESYGGNIIFIGPTGAGKTSIIQKWAHDRNVRVVELNVNVDYLDFSGVVDIDRSGDKPKAYTVSTRKFELLADGSPCILFIDEINKAHPDVLKQLYSVISQHKVIESDGDVLHLDSLLFTVGAMNSAIYQNGRNKLDKALKARMGLLEINYDTEGFKKYLLNKLSTEISYIEEDIEEAKKNNDEQEFIDLRDEYDIKCKQKDLAEIILKDTANFEWDPDTDPEDDLDSENALTPRTLDTTISGCDGTKNGLINLAMRQCGSSGATYLENKLADYVEKDHIANLIWDKNYEPEEEEEPRKEYSEEEKEKIRDDESVINNSPSDLYSRVHNVYKKGKVTKK